MSTPRSHQPQTPARRTLTLTKGVLVCAVALLSADAFAQTVLVAPLVPNPASEKLVYNVHQLIVSEMDYMPGIDGGKELAQRPSQLNSACLSNPGCLSGVLKSGGGDHLLAGELSDMGENISLALVYYDGRTIVRRKSFTLPNDATAIANKMTGVLKEIVTGVSPAAKAAEATVRDFDAPADDFAFGGGGGGTAPAPKPSSNDDFDFEDDGVADAAAAAAATRAAEDAARRAAAEDASRRAAEDASRRAAAEDAARRAAEDEARRRAEEEARYRAEAERQRADAERQRMEAEARARAEEEARRRQAAAAAVPRPAPAPAPAPAGFDPSMISFGAAADKITTEEINSVIRFGGGGSPAPAPSSGTYPPPAAPSSYTRPPGSGYVDQTVLDDEEQELSGLATGPVLQDLDDDSRKPSRDKPAKAPTSTSTSRPTKSSAQVDDRGPKSAQITARAGYSKYHAFNFVTVGAEVGVPVAKTGVMVIAGFEAYSVNRTLPPEFVVAGGPTTEWNTIFPLNVGLLYRIQTGSIVTPYVGADGLFAQYYKDASGADWAAGARARLGADIMVVKNFGLNVNVGVGGWSGSKWVFIDTSVKNSGFLPQLNAGTVVAF